MAFGRMGARGGFSGLGVATGIGSKGLSALNANIGFFGDSITGNGLTGTATAPQYNQAGFTTWGPIFANSIMAQPVNGNKGVFGDTTTQMLARLTAMNALNCQIVSVMGGTNDLAASVSAATIASNLAQICAGLTANYIFLFTVLPRFSPVALTGPQETQRGLLNTAIRALASRKIIIVDCDTLNLVTGDFGDGLHPNASGAYKVGKLWGPLLALKQSGTTTQFDALFTGNPNVNNGMTGSGGTVNASAAGVAANGYTLNGISGGVTTTGSQSTGQVVTFTGSYTGSAVGTTILQGFTTGTMAVGETWEAILSGQILGNFSTNLLDFQLNMQIYDSGFGFLAQTFSFPGVAGTGIAMPLVTTDGVFRMRSPALVMPVGATPVNIGFNINVGINAGTAVATSGSFKILNIAARKVV